jgi:hypothetical protein
LKGKAENDEERFQFLVDKRRIHHSPQATSILSARLKNTKSQILFLATLFLLASQWSTVSQNAISAP